MLFTIIALFVSTLLGFLICCVLVPYAGTAEKFALGYGVGLGILTLGIFILAAIGIPIRASIMIPIVLFVLLALALALFLRLRVRLRPSVGDLGFHAAMLPRHNPLQWLLILLICLVMLASFNIATYWPIYVWDSLTEYDFRARVFLRDESLAILGTHYYYGGIPLQTSLAHAWVYLWGGTSPHLIYWLFYVCLLIIFYTHLHDEVGATQGLIFTAVLALTPIFVLHSTFAFTNLPFAYFYSVSTLYLYRWFKTMQLGDCLIAGALMGLGSWVRTGSEVFLLVNGLILLLWCIYKQRYRPIIYYVGLCMLLYAPWKIYQTFFLSATGQLYEKLLVFELNPARAYELLGYLIDFLFTQKTFGLTWVLFFVIALFSLLRGKDRSLLLLGIIAIDLASWYVQIYSIHLGSLEAFAKESGERLLMTFVPIALFYCAVSPVTRASFVMLPAYFTTGLQAPWARALTRLRRWIVALAGLVVMLPRLTKALLMRRATCVALAGLVVMLPRLLTPYFGLLDDGVTIQVARRVVAGDYSYPFVIGQSFGRFFPVYWYYFVVQYTLWGEHPLGYYIVACLSLGVTAIALARVVRLLSRSALAGWVAGMLFIFSPPIIENYYTLGKSELQLALYLSLSVLCLLCSLDQTVRRRLFFAASLVLLLFAYLTKETTLVMAPISFCWAIAYRLRFGKDSAGRDRAWQLIWYTGANLGCIIGSRILAGLAGVTGVSAGAYSQNYLLSWDVLLNSAIGHLNLLARDYGVVFLLTIAVIVLARWDRRLITEGRLHWIFGACLIWVGGWMGILLPWRGSVQEYYLLPASLGICAAAGIGAEVIRRFWAMQRAGQLAPSAVSAGVLVCVVGVGMLVVCSVVNMSSNGRIQLALDRQNNSMLNELARAVPKDGTVLFNLSDPHEYVVEARLHLQQLKDRPDLNVGYVSPRTLTQISGATTVVNMRLQNPPAPSVRIGGHDQTLARWNAALLGLLGNDAQTTYHSVEALSLPTIFPNIWLCPLTWQLQNSVGLISAHALCPDTSIWHAVHMEYGWDIVRIAPPAHKPADRMIGVFRPESATWILRDLNLTERDDRVLRFGLPGDIPIVGDWDGNGVDGIGVFRPSTREWFLDNNLDSQVDITIGWTALLPGDVPIVGDWNGDGADTIGFFRPSDVSWHLRDRNSDGAEEIPVFQFGLPTDIPIVGDWDGDSKDTIGIYRPDTGEVSIKNSNAGSSIDRSFKIALHVLPRVASWRTRAPGVMTTFAKGHWEINYADCACAAPDPLAPLQIDFGQDGDIPIMGAWNDR